MLAGAYLSFHFMPHSPVIPSRFIADLPPNCRQVVLVLSSDTQATTGQLWLMARNPEGAWASVTEAIPVSLGRGGMAWGLGEHKAVAPEGFSLKMEGDGCSPAGVFRLPFAFGEHPESQTGSLRLPYVALTFSHFGVDDEKSRYYNRIVDESSATVIKDWDSAETMLRPHGLYRWGAMVAHNPMNLPKAGSCIFLHLWRDPSQPTAGCTAMGEEDLKRVLTWLDPAAEPRLVQGCE